MSSWQKIPDFFARFARFLAQSVTKLWSGALHYSNQLLTIWALLYRLLGSTFSTFTGTRLVIRETAKQVYFTAIEGAHVLIFTALMLGLVVIIHSTQQLIKVQGEEYVGWLLVTIVVREVGPVWAGLFVLLHSGGAITAEIGTMNVSRETDALKMMGIDPYRYLGVPRLWGLTISMVVLYILCTISAVLGGFFFAQLFADIFWDRFWESFLHNLEFMDLVTGVSQVRPLRHAHRHRLHLLRLDGPGPSGPGGPVHCQRVPGGHGALRLH